MRRGRIVTTLALSLPLLAAPLACGDNNDRQALEQDELDRDLNVALGGDSVPATFEDTAVAPTENPTPQRQPQPSPTPQRRPATQRPQTTQPRTPSPEPRPSPQPRTVTLTVPVGTTFAVRMNDELSTKTSSTGDAFTATLSAPIVDASGTVIVPAGATVRGRVTAVSPSTRVGQTAAMKLAFEAISFGGESYPLQGSVERADVQRSNRTSTAETAGKVAAGAAAGAILGQVLGKNTSSTLKGAAIGAAAGTAIAMGTSDVDAVLPRGAEVVVRVDQPITVTKTVSQ